MFPGFVFNGGHESAVIFMKIYVQKKYIGKKYKGETTDSGFFWISRLFRIFLDFESAGFFWTFKNILNIYHLNMVLVYKNSQWIHFKAVLTS